MALRLARCSNSCCSCNYTYALLVSSKATTLKSSLI